VALTNLVAFIVYGNPIEGNFPAFFGNFQKLEQFDISLTLIEGNLPSLTTRMPALKYFNIGFNSIGAGQDLGAIRPFEKFDSFKKIFPS